MFVNLCALYFSKAGLSLYHMFRRQDEGSSNQRGSAHYIVMICEQMCYWYCSYKYMVIADDDDDDDSDVDDDCDCGVMMTLEVVMIT